MKKSIAIKAISGVLVVALVVVVALAIAGVFSVNTPDDPSNIANAEASVQDNQVIRDISTDKVFYFTSSNIITDINSYVSVRANGENVAVKISEKKDDDGHYGFIAESGNWLAGVAYRVTLSGGISLIDEGCQGLSTFVFIVDAPEADEYELKENAVDLHGKSFSVAKIPAQEDRWILTIEGVDELYNDNAIFIYQVKKGEDAPKFVGEDETYNTFAYKVDANIGYNYSNGVYTATVMEADADEIYESLNVHQKNVEITEDTFIVDEDMTLKAFQTSDVYLNAIQYLYGEQLGKKEFKVGDCCTFKLEYDFKQGSPSYATFNVTFTAKGFLKSAKNAIVTIKIANRLTPVADVHFQKDPMAFNASVNLELETGISVEGGFDYDFDNTDEKNNTEANLALKTVVSNLKKIVSDALNTTSDSEKPFIFATWYIPVGTTPLQIVENLGVEVKSEIKARVGASAKNVVNCEIGVAYVDKEVSPIFNISDTFNMGAVSVQGTMENKVGLYNEIGITACGLVSLTVDASVGFYLDLAGRLEMDGWNILNTQMNIIPAYYIETGIYLDMGIKGKVWKFKVANGNLVNKKWPLKTFGYKYIPQGIDENKDGIDDYFHDETMYMSSSYFYFTTFEAYALDIQNIKDDGSKQNISWDEFDYEVSDNNLIIQDNKVRISPTSEAEFESVITITSKVNKAFSKQIKVIKTPEVPTCEESNKSYLKGSNSNVNYMISLNTSKFIGVSNSANPISNSNYVYEDGILTINNSYLEDLPYGDNTIVFESSKGYVRLNLEVVSDKNVIPEGGFKELVYDKGNATTPSWNMPLYGNSIESVGLDHKYWSYSNATESFKLYSSALADLNGGEVLKVGVNFSNGESCNLVVNVVDNRQPKLKTNTYEYLLGSQNNLVLDMDLFGKEITKVELGANDITQYVDGTTIKAEAFARASAVKANLSIYCGDSKYSAVITFAKSNILIVNSKYAVYDKANPENIHFVASIPDGAVLSCESGLASVSGFAQNDGYLSISSDYLNGLESGEYTFKIKGCDNDVSLVVLVENNTVPTMNTESITFVKGEVREKLYTWNLQEASFVGVDGLASDEWEQTATGLKVNFDNFGYGTKTFTVITSMASFDINVTVNGQMKWVTDSYSFNARGTQPLQIKVDMADKDFSEIKFLSDGKELEIYPTQFRYNEGVITISNDFAYNLSAGNYSIAVYAVDGSYIDGGVVSVLGELKSFLDVEGRNGSKAAPYLIFNADQFRDIAKQLNKKLLPESSDGVYFELMADIDLEYNAIDPIGTEKHPFKGSFNGNGYSISNIVINGTNDGYAGLFGYNEGVISNIRLANIKIDVKKNGTVGLGLIAGKNSGEISRITLVNGSIKAVSESWAGIDLANAYFDIGGAVGWNEGTIKRVTIDSISITAEAKGLSVVGIQIGGRKSAINAGALVGYLKGGRVERCSAGYTVNATAANNNVSNNGWYGYTELSEEELKDAFRRVDVTSK